ncbi:hypothetical protein Halar_0516 (plasmid) [halophilic archaeon DL31]|jgi:hypothetical protein|nr:hypothetical protein Halar_0516 [halophilic archaeon DL31]
MTESTNRGVHSPEDIPNAPEGWLGGDLIHTGGEIYVREWLHPEEGIRVGYSVTEPEKVAVEEVKLAEGKDETNPLNWKFVETREKRQCDDEGECLESAIQLMTEYSPADSR